MDYNIQTDPDCGTQLNQNAHMKLLAVNEDENGWCLILWTCRPSREGVHAFCTQPQQTLQQQQWIASQYALLDLTEVVVTQNTVLEGTKCFVSS